MKVRTRLGKMTIVCMEIIMPPWHFATLITFLNVIKNSSQHDTIGSSPWDDAMTVGLGAALKPGEL